MGSAERCVAKMPVLIAWLDMLNAAGAWGSEPGVEVQQDLQALCDSLSDHKQRLAAQSARLAAAESEVRRLRRVIEAAETVHAVRSSTGIILQIAVCAAEKVGLDDKVQRWGAKWVPMKIIEPEVINVV